MYTPINQIQPPDDQDEDHNDVVQESSSFLSYYNHNFACFNGVSTAPSDPFQFQSASPPKKRKSEAADGGGRVVRAAGRKDRHSKVRTARGPRDRRVRLSPTTAIQFYDVQDRLGYDRPSKAIDWLIKEAKAAIDALDCELPRASNAAEDHGGGFSLIMRNKHEHLNDNDILASSGFGCFSGEAAATDVAAPPPAAGCLDRDYELGCFPALYPNWEMARLQKMFTWNSVNESLGNARGEGGGGAEYSSCNSIAAAQPNSGHANLFREPLQSSYASINNDFGGFNFSSELSKIAASATPKQDENLKKLIFSNYHQE